MLATEILIKIHWKNTSPAARAIWQWTPTLHKGRLLSWTPSASTPSGYTATTNRQKALFQKHPGRGIPARTRPRVKFQHPTVGKPRPSRRKPLSAFCRPATSFGNHLRYIKTFQNCHEVRFEIAKLACFLVAFAAIRRRWDWSTSDDFDGRNGRVVGWRWHCVSGATWHALIVQSENCHVCGEK